VTAFVVLVQVLLPLGLLAWLARFPAPSRAGRLAQAAGVGLFLFALARVAMWTVPPWWTPWAFVALWAAIAGRRLVRAGKAGARGRPTGMRAWPVGTGELVSLAVSLLLAALGAVYGLAALKGRALPPVAVVDIPNPLGPGRYLVGHGGSHETVNAHMKTLDASDPDMRAWRGQGYALDVVAVDRLGTRAHGWRPADPGRYRIFGAPVPAPCAGEIVGAENGMPDLRVPETDRGRPMGNHVLLRCGDFVLLLAHLRQGSVAVRVGESVVPGALLGQVGNSGNSSEPHLHLHAQRPGENGSPVAGEPLALRIDGRFLVRNDRFDGRQW